MIYAHIKPEKLIKLSYLDEIHARIQAGTSNWRRQVLNILSTVTAEEMIELRIKVKNQLIKLRDQDDREFWEYVNIAVQNKMNDLRTYKS